MAKVKIGKWKISESDLDAQLAAAEERAAEADRAEPRAIGASYDHETGRIVLDLDNGCTFLFPPSLLEELNGASPEELAKVEVSPQGTEISWEDLDAYYGVVGLLAGVFGTRSWMAELGKKGGRAKSPAKAIAARENGRKGGRPRKDRAGEPPRAGRSRKAKRAAPVPSAALPAVTVRLVDHPGLLVGEVRDDAPLELRALHKVAEQLRRAEEQFLASERRAEIKGTLVGATSSTGRQYSETIAIPEVEGAVFANPEDEGSYATEPVAA